MARFGQVTKRPPLTDAANRGNWIPSRLSRSCLVLGATSRGVGQHWNPNFVPRRARDDARPRCLNQRHVVIRLRGRAGYRRRRRDYRGGKHLPAPGRAWERLTRIDQGRAGDCKTCRLCRADYCGSLHALDVRARHDGQDLSRYSTHRNSVFALLTRRVADDPAGASITHTQTQAAGSLATIPGTVRQRSQTVRRASLSTPPRDGTAVEVCDGVSGRRSNDSDDRLGTVGTTGFPLFPVDRSRFHVGNVDDATRHASGRHL